MNPGAAISVCDEISAHTLQCLQNNPFHKMLMKTSDWFGIMLCQCSRIYFTVFEENL